MNSSTATPILTSVLFDNLNGTNTDPLPVVIKNNDAAATVYIGGSNVSSSNGYALGPGQSIEMQLIGEPTTDIPYGLSSTDTPTVCVLVGRQ